MEKRYVLKIGYCNDDSGEIEKRIDLDTANWYEAVSKAQTITKSLVKEFYNINFADIILEELCA